MACGLEQHGPGHSELRSNRRLGQRAQAPRAAYRRPVAALGCGGAPQRAKPRDRRRQPSSAKSTRTQGLTQAQVAVGWRGRNTGLVPRRPLRSRHLPARHGRNSAERESPSNPH